MNRTVLTIISLLVWPLIGMATVKPVKAVIHKAPQRTTRSADDKKGVKATLKYEQIADMPTARMGHQVLPSGNGFVVVGGRTTGFRLTKTAELWQNGTWTSLSIGNAHDGAFSVKLSDGRYMVGGGFSSDKGQGQSRATDIYDPQTRTFTAGPQLTTARAQSMAINVNENVNVNGNVNGNDNVYVSGNWYANDPTMDYYNGSSFKAVGETDGRSNPYMMADRQGNLLVFSIYNTTGDGFGFYTDSDGQMLLLADRYTPATGETKYFGLPFSSKEYPVALPDDTRPSDYHITYSGNNCYLMLVKLTSGYELLLFDVDDLQLYQFDFDIPTIDDAGNAITWRGGLLTNVSRKELYMIGTSGPATNQTLHVISLNYVTDEWTIASATGFKHNLLTASCTVLDDGRIACTGGGIKDNTDAQRTAYLITPTVAGQGDVTPDEGPMVDRNFLVVETKDHVQTTYMLAEKPQVRFEGQNLRVVSAKADVTYKLEDILRFTYEKRSVTGVSELKADPATVDYEDGELVISGIKAGGAVGVYSLDGKLVRQLTARHAGTYRLSLSALPKGVYIVKADNVTYKIMKR